MNIDFTKLAKIAFQNKKAAISQFLIGYEQSIVKKIPFLLETDQHEEALKFAMDSGDPNIIDKVFTEILSKARPKGMQEINTMLNLVFKTEDAVRHLRNYAKKRKDASLLDCLINFQNQKLQNEAKNQPMAQASPQINILRDYTQSKMFIQEAYQCERLEERFQRLQAAGDVLVRYNKDDFYSKLVGELEDVNLQQAKYYKAHPQEESIMRSSLAEFITRKLTGDDVPEQQLKAAQAEVKHMRVTYKLPEQAYWSIVFRAYAQDAMKTADGAAAKKKWQTVQSMIQEKKPSVPCLTMGELLLEANSKDLAIQAIRREERYEPKINMLIDAAAWLEAVEETFAKKKHPEFENFVDMIRAKGPPFVEDFIREQQMKKK